MPVTFLREGSYAKLKGYAGSNTLNISLEFRTYENHGLLIYHKFNTEGHVKVTAHFVHILFLTKWAPRGQS